MGSKIFRFLLVGFGVVVLISGITNLMTTVTLLQPGDEAAIGLNRNAMIGMATICILAGGGLIFMGLRKRK